MPNKQLFIKKDKNMRINWCNYEWDCKGDGNSIIHPDYPYAWYSNSPEVLEINENGEMSLSYRENPQEVKYWDGRVFYPTIERAFIRTTTPFNYGTFLIEAKVPRGLNLWSAFWLSGDGNWPPEIDILEAWSENNNYAHSLTNHFPWLCKSWRTTYNVHYNDKNMKHQQLGSKNVTKCDQPLDPIENWIKYECVWEPDKITFKANGKVTKTVSKKYANMLTKNLKDPQKGYLMDVIVEININDPKEKPNELATPFMVRNFEYKPL